MLGYAIGEIIELSLADKISRIGATPIADDFVDNKRPCRNGQLFKLFPFGVVRRAIWTRVDKNCTFAALRSFKQA